MTEHGEWVQPKMFDPENDDASPAEPLADSNVLPEDEITPETPGINSPSPDSERSKKEDVLAGLQRKLDRLEKLKDDGVLPGSAYWEIDSLEEQIQQLEDELYEPVSIFVVRPEDFIRHFEVYYKKYLLDPFGKEGQHFEGLVRLIRKRDVFLRGLERNPFYIEYSKTN